MYNSFLSVRVFALILVLSIGVAVPGGSVSAAQLIYSNDLDLGGFGDIKTERDCYAGAFTLAKSPSRAGQSIKIFNDGTKACLEPSGKLKHRKEVRWGSDTTYSELNTPYWFAFSMFVPDDYPTKADNPNAVIVAQWIGGNVGPELTFQLVAGERLAIRRTWSTGVSDGKHSLTEAKLPIERGVWTDFVVYRERSWNSDGVLKVWMNGVKVVDFVGPTAINYVTYGSGNKGNIQFKTGIYWAEKPRDVQYTLYFDNVRTAKGADGYDLVSRSAKNASSTTSAKPPQPPSWF